MTAHQQPSKRIQTLVSSVFEAAEELSRLTGRPFSPDGHFVGSLGEVLAAIELDLELATPSTEGYDAVDPEGRRVEIKATARGAVALSASGTRAERLVVVHIDTKGTSNVIYDGPALPAWEVAGKPQKNGQRRISLTKLTTLLDQQESAAQ